jgi:uncharacterized protein
MTVRTATVAWVTRALDEAGGLERYRDDGPRYVAKTKPGGMEHVKFIESMANVLGVDLDADVKGLVDAWGERLIEAQSDDGYLASALSAFPLTRRWEPVPWSHEDYLIGHYIEAAIAYRDATGDRALFDSAVLAADNMVKEVLEADLPYTSGHPEIEQALMRLYGTTGNDNYLRLCGWLIGQRGRHEERPSFGRNRQDHVRVCEQRTIEGHAVRAAFLFNGVTEYVGATGDNQLRDAALAVWADLVNHKMWLHGASGNLSATNEGYPSAPHDIPPDDCYGESCAAYGNFRWAHSLFSLTGEAHYIDVAERILYNAFAASLSLDGTSSFYTNVAQTGLPGTAHGALTLGSAEPRPTMRFPELADSCCPPNIVKLISTVGGFIYATDELGIYVKHYGASEANIPWGDGIKIVQRTSYPWDGSISMLVELTRPQRFALRLRVPEWAKEFRLSIAGEEPGFTSEAGWLTIERDWQSTTEVRLALAMQTERVTMPPEFKGYDNRAALKRGPIVYCLEEQDIEYERASATPELGLPFLFIPSDAEFAPTFEPGLLGGVTVLRGELSQLSFDGTEERVRATFVPYAVWGNRGPSEMRIWLGAHRGSSPWAFFRQQRGFRIDPSAFS